MSLNRREFLKFSAGVSAAASSLSGGALQGAANEGEKRTFIAFVRCALQGVLSKQKSLMAKFAF